MADKILTIAFIGGGGIARCHANWLRKFENVRIVGCTEINEESCQWWRSEFDIPTFSDHQEMLAELKPDAVDICTPNFLHYQPSLDALRAGAHVFVEKPMAMRASECQEMLDVANANGRKIVVGFQHRFEPRVQYISKAVEAGRFGKILYTRVSIFRRRGIPNWGVFGRKDLQGGGCLIDIGVHALDMAWYAIGKPKPVAVSGNTWRFIGTDKDKAANVACMWPNWDTESYTVEDLAAGQIRFADNSLLTLETSFAMHNQEEGYNFTIYGEQAGATLDPLKIYTDDFGHMVDVTPAYLPNTEVWDIKVRGMIDHFLHDGPNLASGEDGLHVQQMLDGIYESARIGREVRI